MVTFSATNNRHTDVPQVSLKVVTTDIVNQYGLVSKSSILAFKPGHEGDFVSMYARTYPQFVLKFHLTNEIALGSIGLNEAQQLNFEVTADSNFLWSIYEATDKPVEDILLDITKVNQSELDRNELRSNISKFLWNSTVTVHERIVYQHNDLRVCFRISELFCEQEDELEEDDYRGKVESSTTIRFKILCNDLELRGPDIDLQRKKSTNIIDVYCNDEEWFPVNRRLLQPCIALAPFVLAARDQHQHVNVDLDCCTFDKCLIYLQLETQGKADEFEFHLHETDQLLEAAKKLGLIGLSRICEQSLGEYSNGIRHQGIPWDEVKERNTNGECLLIIDNQVFDVSNWLEHHPGGNVIIPNQAKNCDATVFFEVYHSSRESFLFLKQLYIGPLLNGQDVPSPTTILVDPSESFLIQLREYMGQIKLFKNL